MKTRGLRSLALLTSLSAALSGCGTSPPQVGRVVVAPEVTRPAVPTIVRETQPQEPGYYRQKILDALESP